MSAQAPTRRELVIYGRLQDWLERVGAMSSVIIREQGATDKEISRNGAMHMLLLVATEPVLLVRLSRIVRAVYACEDDQGVAVTPGLLEAAVRELHEALPAELLEAED